MLWTLKSALFGIGKRFIFVTTYIYLIIFFENKEYITFFSDYLKNKKFKIPNQLIVLGGLFLYSFIIEKLNFTFNFLPKLRLDFVLNKRHKVISCQYYDNETRANVKKVIVKYEKNFDNIIGRFMIFFLEKYYFFILEISYPKAIDLKMEFLDEDYGYETRYRNNEFKKKLKNYQYVHIKNVFTYYIKIDTIGDFSEYENEYKCFITTKGNFCHSKIKSNLDIYSKNKIARLFYPLASLFFFIFVNFKGLNAGITSEEGE